MVGAGIVHRFVRLARFRYFKRMCAPFAGFTKRSIIYGCRSDLASEDAVTYECVEQHQGEDDHASPEHERKTGLRRGRLVDRNYERDHVGPKGQRQSGKCRREDHRDHVERPTVVVAEDAECKHDCCDHTNRGKYEEIRSIDPTMQNWEMLSECVNKNEDEEHQYGNRENADLTARPVADLGVALLHQPTGTKKCVAQAQADATEDRKWRETAEVTTGILTVGDLQPLDQNSDGCPLHKACDQGSGSKAQIPDPPHSLRL